MSLFISVTNYVHFWPNFIISSNNQIGRIGRIGNSVIYLFIQALSDGADQAKVAQAFAKTYGEVAIENLLGFIDVSISATLLYVAEVA